MRKLYHRQQGGRRDTILAFLVGGAATFHILLLSEGQVKLSLRNSVNTEAVLPAVKTP